MTFVSTNSTALNMEMMGGDFGYDGPVTYLAETVDTIVTMGLSYDSATGTRWVERVDLMVDTRVSVMQGDRVTELYGSGFTFDAEGALTGGTIRQITMPFAYAPTATFTAINLSVEEYLAVAATPWNDDDRSLFRGFFAGNDLFLGSDQPDLMFMGAGKDMYIDVGGNDIVLGETGDDLMAAVGNDTLIGGQGNDILMNYEGNSVMRGGRGDDILVGGMGSDRMVGWTGRDSFVFTANNGHHVIRDFTVGEDHIVALDFASSMDDLTIRQDGDNTVISEGEWSVILRGVDHTTLSESDFVFGNADFLQNAMSDFLTGWSYAA